jgi:2-(1,2-epoxy-1,2-dihydrophenyl)acetyl-CoA isomerase
VIQTSLDGGIATIRLASPETANALTPQAFGELREAITHWQQPDSGASVLVLTGGSAGSVFSAGANLDVLGTTSAADLARQITQSLLPIQTLLHQGRLPTLAAVNGHVVGGAIGLVLWFDIVIAARSAKFSFAFSKLGLVPDTGLSATLPRLVGEARARGWFMSGAEVSADQAQAAGMIFQTADDLTFEDEVMKMAHRLAKLPPASFALTRKAMSEALLQALPAQIELEAQLQAERVTSEDFRAAIAAFAQRRRVQG